MNQYLKIKSWYENKLLLFRWKRGLRKSFIKEYGETPSRITKILSAICLFWKRHWGNIILIILAAITLFVIIKNNK